MGARFYRARRAVAAPLSGRPELLRGGLQAWPAAARLAVAAPWVVLGMLAMRPESISAYSTGTGALVLLAGGVVSTLAYRLMIHIGRLPEDERVLR